jgi:hypothetical protein
VDSFNVLVNLAITQEDCIMAHRAEKKRKAPVGPSSAQPPRYHLVQNTPVAPIQKAPQQGRWVIRPPQQPQQPQGHNAPSIPQHNVPRPNVQPGNRPDYSNRCFKCGSPSHFAKQCTQSGQYQGQGSHRDNHSNKNKKQTVQVKQGRLNFTTLADLPEGAPILSGTFSVSHKPTLILFDSGAFHSFINAKFGAKVGPDFLPY